MPYINETDYQELTEARYQDEQTIADLEAELKTKERDTEHLLELGKQFAALTSERDRLRELLQQIYDEGYAAELRPDIQVILVSDEN